MRGAETVEGGRGFTARAAAVVLLAACVRAGTALWTFPVTPLGDELYYAETAVRIARGEGHVFGPHRLAASWPPGQAALLAPFADTTLTAKHPELLVELSRLEPQDMQERHRRFLAPLVAVATAVGTLVVALAVWLARIVFDRRTALVAGALAAIDPMLVASSHHLWSENLFTALVTGALVAALSWWRRPAVGRAVLAGALFGLAALTREIGFLVAAAAGGWWILASPRGARSRAALHAGLMLLAAAAVIAPWAARNQARLGFFAPVSTVGWMGLREGNTLAIDAWFQRDWEAVREFRRRFTAIPSEEERVRVARSEALTLIREAQPAWVLRKLVINVSELFSPGNDLLFKLRQGAHGPVPAVWHRAALLVSVASWSLVLSLAAFGAAGAPDRARRWLPVILFAPVLVVHVAANAFPKYRMPLLPVLFAYAGFALASGWRELRARAGSAGLGAAGAVLAVYAAVVLPRFLPEAMRTWSRGAPSGGAAAAATVPDTSAPPRPRRILLLSLDTVRADRVSGFGPEGTTPALARIAAEGARFPRFYAASNYTIPSHMTIFTGLDPVEHGVTKEEARLSPSVPTLAEILREAGFRTRGFHEGGYVEARFGFARGFEVYRRYPRVEVVRKGLPVVLEWIAEQGDEPWFLFLHTYAAHFPYGGWERHLREHPEHGHPDAEAVRELRRRFPGNRILPRRELDAIPLDVRYECSLYNQLAETHARLLPCGEWFFGPEFRDSPRYAADLDAIRASYDERIRLADAAVARLREALEARGQWHDTLFITTADHGEAFYEHGLARHDYVPFDEVMRVPLVVSWPAFFGDGGGRVVDELAWHLDLLPTILALAGIQPPVGLRGRDLSGALAGRAATAPERAVFPAVLRPAKKPQLPRRRVAIQGRFKWIEGHPFYSSESLLFDLAADPGEQVDLGGAQPDRAAALSDLARGFEAQLAPRPPVHQATGLVLSEDAPPLELSPELEGELRALGYVE
jgi:arylsulfatase A-like enzyme/4-amino-4-deoxy-L-arabinose transferase-like glycosyltransferase